MTPEHGYIYIAIGAALFASLLVAWLLGRRGKKFPKQCPACGEWRHPEGFADFGPWYRVAPGSELRGWCKCCGAEVWHEEAHDDKRAGWRSSKLRIREVARDGDYTITMGDGKKIHVSSRTVPMLDAKKPYASEITGTGSRPEAPWASKEDFDKLKALVQRDILNRAAAPLYEDRPRDTTLVVREEDGVQYVQIAGWKRRLEAGGEGDGWGVFRDGERWTRVFTDGWRAFKAADWTWVWDGNRLYVSCGTWPWTPSGYSYPAELYEQVAGPTELHGPERARIVREFLEWKGAQ